MSDHKITQTLQHARFLVGITQEEAGELVGVSRRAWAHWENGTRVMPSAAFQLFIAKISGQISSHIQNQLPREIVVIMDDDSMSPLDVVSSDNFLSLTPDHRVGRYIVSSLAIDRLTGKRYTHRVSFAADRNEHVLKAAEKWKQ